MGKVRFLLKTDIELLIDFEERWKNGRGRDNDL